MTNIPFEKLRDGGSSRLIFDMNGHELRGLRKIQTPNQSGQRWRATAGK